MHRYSLRRWSPRSNLLLVLAVACGVGAFALVHGYQARLEALRPIAGEPEPVVVAAEDLTRGTVLAEDSVNLVSVPSAFAEPGAFRSVQDVVGRTLVSDLGSGEAVTRTRVGTAGGPVAAQVPSGLRAFAVPSGMPAGSVRPGDRVDVLATFGGQRPYTETAASGLEVLSVLEASGGLVASGADQGPTLVLLVSPDDAERLAYAKAFADLTVTVAGVET